MAKQKQKKKRPMTLAEKIAHEEKYIAFLQRALASENFKANDPERYEQTKQKYDRAKFRLKTLRMGK